jgi:glycosyltransferase involved in cell wall biosynthesis
MFTPTVHILLATYNGEKFLKEQLDSIARQTHCAWTLTVSDDGSTDDTLIIVHQFANQVSQRVTVLHGPQKGSTHNFFHLIQHAQTDNPQDLYAFCDQDDVWLEEKLARAVSWHNSQTNQAVRLYCGRTQFVNEQLKPLGLSPGIRRTPSFGNALVQNIASGNTMVMSHDVLLAQMKVHPEHSVWHDWTTYLVATALGGLIWFDDEPCLLYRQHSGNVIGANNSIKLVVEAFSASIRGRYLNRIKAQLGACNDIDHLLTPDNHSTQMQFFSILKNMSIASKIILWRRSSIRRQTPLSNLALALALLTKRL